MDTSGGGAAGQALRELRGLHVVKGVPSFLQLREVIILPDGVAVILQCVSPFPGSIQIIGQGYEGRTTLLCLAKYVWQRATGQMSARCSS